MRELLRLLRAFYRQRGYLPYHMSSFENYELYADKKDFLISDKVITFSDTDGSLRALRPDVTLSIVKSAELQPGEKKKLYYQENVYRPSGGTGRVREIMQCGLECLGDLDSGDLSEVLELAALSLSAVSAESMLCFSHLGIADALFRKLRADEAQQAEILKLIAGRNRHELAELFSRQGWPDTVLQDLKSLLSLSCSLRELPEQLAAYSWIGSELPLEIATIEDRCGARFDFSIIGDTHYYNGLVFQGFIPGISGKLLSGGQYDRLMARMKRKGKAIGFAVYLNLLPQTDEEPEVLVLYDDRTGEQELWDTVFSLRAQGKRVAVQFSPAVADIRGGKRDA